MMKKGIVLTVICLMAVLSLFGTACAESRVTQRFPNYSVKVPLNLGYLERNNDGSALYSRETEIKNVDAFTIEQLRLMPFFTKNGRDYYYDFLTIVPEYFGDKINHTFDRIRTQDGVYADTFAIYMDDGSMIYGAIREENEPVNGVKDYLMVYATGQKKHERHLKKAVDDVIFSSQHSPVPIF